MKINIIYHSKFGNNEKIADFLADQFSADVSVYSTKEHHPRNIIDADIYIICSPTHVGNAPFKIRRFVRHIKFSPNARYAIVATYADPKSKAAKTLSEILDKKARKIGELKLGVKSMKGPLEEDWEKKIKQFAKDLIFIK